MTIARWTATTIRDLKNRHLSWKPDPKKRTIGLSQGASLFPVFYNVCTEGLVDVESKGLTWVLPLAGDGVIHRTASDTDTAVTAIHEQLEKVL